MVDCYSLAHAFAPQHFSRQNKALAAVVCLWYTTCNPVLAGLEGEVRRASVREPWSALPQGDHGSSFAGA